MTIEGAILGRLKAVAAVTNLVGAGANARIYAMRLPQAPTLEAIVFQRISAQRVHAWGSDPGLVRARFQLDCWGSTFEEARALADAVRGALSRFRGTVDTTIVVATILDNESDRDEDATGTYRSFQDYLVDYQE